MSAKVPARSSRRAAERRGRRSEFLASILLIAKGYRILGRRVRTHMGEIDLVARAPGGMICFVEVKAREAFEDAVVAVMPRQQARIARAAELFLAQRPGLNAKEVRFDTITVARGWLPRHLRDAWRA
jgi:putative endonuclease